MPTHIIASLPAGASFRERLQRELARRCARNPRYSLRAFANFLGIDHATLSQLLRGKRPVTAATVKRLGARIGFTSAEIDDCIARLRVARDTPPPESQSLAADAAQVLAQWHAFAILELMRLAEFRPDVRWIARMLGVEPDEISIALQQLIRLGFLQMAAPGRWVDLTHGASLREDEFTLLALERLAARSRALQLASARNAPDALRFHGSATIAVSAERVTGLLAMAERFVDDARAYVAGSPGDRLYQIDLHCLPLTTAGAEPIASTNERDTTNGTARDSLADRQPPRRQAR